VLRLAVWTRFPTPEFGACDGLLVVVEGRDGAGKSTLVQALSLWFGNRSRVVCLGPPTDDELRRGYFDRWLAHLPAPGEVVLLDRSWYNRAGLERVMGFATERQVEQFFEQVPHFERAIVRSGIRLFKLWMHIDRDEQARRLRARDRMTEIDRSAIERWDAYSRAEAEVFRRTHTGHAPWIQLQQTREVR